MTTRSGRSIRFAILAGWHVTFGVAAVAGIWVLVGYWATDGANVKRIGMSLPALLLVYGIAAAASGVIYGLTQPLRSRFWGRVVSGIMIGCIVGWTVALAMYPERSLGYVATVGCVYGVLIGGGWGAVWLRRPVDTEPDQ